MPPSSGGAAAIIVLIIAEDASKFNVLEDESRPVPLRPDAPAPGFAATLIPMFTGLVQHVGRIESIAGSPPQRAQTRAAGRDAGHPGATGPFGLALGVDPCGWEHRPQAGESIAVNGCCLTVSAAPPPGGAGGGLLRFDLVPQTLSLTTLGEARAGDRVNLEHAVTPATLMGGHIVQGHIDGVGRVIRLESGAADGDRRARITSPAALMPAIVPQGSIAVDGVSLTIAAAGEDWFEVALIPATLAATTLGDLRAGSRVNIETDYIARLIAAWMTKRDRRIEA